MYVAILHNTGSLVFQTSLQLVLATGTVVIAKDLHSLSDSLLHVNPQ